MMSTMLLSMVAIHQMTTWEVVTVWEVVAAAAAVAAAEVEEVAVDAEEEGKK